MKGQHRHQTGMKGRQAQVIESNIRETSHFACWSGSVQETRVIEGVKLYLQTCTEHRPSTYTGRQRCERHSSMAVIVAANVAVGIRCFSLEVAKEHWVPKLTRRTKARKAMWTAGLCHYIPVCVCSLLFALRHDGTTFEIDIDNTVLFFRSRSRVSAVGCR